MDTPARSRGYWCTRGGLFALVHAPSVDDAREKASRAMNRGEDGITVRVASPADRDRWAVLLEQTLAGAAGLRVDAPPEGEQLSLVA